jgi:GNAT superfamily N-acetyltransferase
VVIAEVEGRAVGFVAWRGAELDALYVLPDAAGRGVGSRLLDRAGAVSTLWVLEANHPARRFYERRGWSPDGTARPGGGGRPEVRYVRRP